jgi:hypothetical protein
VKHIPVSVVYHPMPRHAAVAVELGRTLRQAGVSEDVVESLVALAKAGGYSYISDPGMGRDVGDCLDRLADVLGVGS